MKQKITSILAVVLLLAISAATVMATFVIESIIWTGLLCSIIATVCAVFAAVSKKYRIAIASALVPLFAFGLFVAEAAFLNLGPRNAALPFCIVFLLLQALITILILTELQSEANHEKSRTQLSIRSALIATSLIAVAFAAIEKFPSNSVPFVSDWSIAIEHPWIAATSFSFALLTTAVLATLLWKIRSQKNVSQPIA